MAKSKPSRRKSSLTPIAAKSDGYKKPIMGGLIVLCIVWYGYSVSSSNQVQEDFEALSAAGQETHKLVKSHRDLGQTHLQRGQGHEYSSRFPTSGPHAQVWTRTGIYDFPQFPKLLVHSLEHGNVVIYYDKPGAEVINTIKQWTGLYPGQWDGLIVAPMSGLGKKIVLNAWTKQLDLAEFDAAAAAAFIDRYRGRGPENKVR